MSSGEIFPDVERLLCRAHDIIKEGRWTRGALARDKDGYPVSARQPEAVSFCSLGALDRARHEQRHSYPVYDEAVRALKRNVHGGAIAHWNDFSPLNHDDVADKFCQVIRQVREIHGLKKMGDDDA